MSEPPITRIAYHMSGYQGRPTRIVHHDEEYPEIGNAAEDVAAFFAGASSGGSAHYLTDNNSEQHCVPDNRSAWHAPPNADSIGIEQSGYARQTRDEWLDDYSRSNLARTCARTAELAVRFQLPIVYLAVPDLLAGRQGITSHNNVSLAWRQSDHSDPGGAYPWDIVLPVVREGARLIGSPAATKSFQASKGLATDGDAGILTVLALGSHLRPVLDFVAKGTKPSPTPAGSVPSKPSSSNRFASYPQVQLGVGLTGAASGAVRDLQHALNVIAGSGLTEDGRFGNGTDRALRNFQAFFKLAVDGVCGPKTWGLLDYLLDLKHL